MIPDVHLFLCIDKKISPGVVLQCLDMMRARDWQQEIILVCDDSWKRFINVEQPVLLLNRDDFFRVGVNKITREINENKLEEFFEQLDDMRITKVTQIGDLLWGKWILSYLEFFHQFVEYKEINCSGKNSNSVQLINELSEELKIDLSPGGLGNSRKTDVFLDPYRGEYLSREFLKILSHKPGKNLFPQWLYIVVQPKDRKFFVDKDLENRIIDREEVEMSLLNQPVLCFSDNSPFALTSRAYNVALYNTETDQSAFIQGDIHISPKLKVSFSEIIDILDHWRVNRLQDLVFGGLDWGIEIHSVENFYRKVVKKNLFPHLSLLHH